MSPRITALEQLIERREKRRFRVTVLFGVAVAMLVLAVSYSLYADWQQGEQIRTVSACAQRPGSSECAIGHANSVALTTPAEACFILAQGGLRCKRPLRETGKLRLKLLTNDLQAVP